MGPVHFMNTLILILGLWMAQNTYSVDRMTLLFYCPMLDPKFSATVDLYLKEYFQDHFEPLGSTENYQYHFKSKSGLDIQIQPKNMKRIKKEQKEVNLSSPGVLLVDEYQNTPQDYNLRLEYNPSNGRHPLWKVSSILAPFFAINQRSPHWRGSDIKISRIDHAVDIFNQVNLACIYIQKASKYSIFGGDYGIQTVNIGTRRSATQLTAYNKKIQMKEVFNIDSNHDYWYRFEYRNTKGFNLYDHDQVKENLFSNIFILGDLPSYNIFPKKNGYLWYYELAEQYLTRIKDQNNFFTLNDALSRARSLDKNNNKDVYNYIKSLLMKSQFSLKYEHPAKTFESKINEKWDTEFTKILQYLGLKEYHL